jgi:hypothetical protein
MPFGQQQPVAAGVLDQPPATLFTSRMSSASIQRRLIMSATGRMPNKCARFSRPGSGLSAKFGGDHFSLTRLIMTE